MKIPSGQYGLIYADPPWAYEMYSEKGYEKSPDVHYNCMKQDELKDLRDQILFSTAPDCVLFMWAVWPKLDEALELMNHWGFKFKTGGAWHKKTKNWLDGFGTGYIVRSACEPYLIGTIGEPKTKNKNTRNILETCVIEDQLREHSRKPDQMVTILENLFHGPYLEMFARTERLNWTVCGNETDKFMENIE